MTKARKIDEAKKRLMFSSVSDFYYIIYNILIFLKEMGCVSEKKVFQDYRKLASLVDILSNTDLIKYVTPIPKVRLSEEEKSRLIEVYTRSKERDTAIVNVLKILNTKRYITLVSNSEKRVMGIFLNKKELPKDFFDEELYNVEINNAKAIRSAYPNISSTLYDTYISNVFKKNGIIAWLG